ncbi:MAG: CPBP family glutamic-type intramembrane protease [Gemmatimonadales bacterium]
MLRTQYLAESRSPRYAILFAVPLWIAYETMAWLLSTPGGPGVRNGADVLLKAPFVRLAGTRGVIGFEVFLLAIAAWLVVRDWRRHPGPLRIGVFGIMALEAAVLALIVGVVLRYATATLLHYFTLSSPAGLGTSTQLMVSLGAGIYEELLFRVILVGGLSWLAGRAFGWSPRGAAIFAVLVSALLFSAFHYVGAYGDTLRLSSFLFRLLAGLVFSTLYVVRGFGITAWTHTLYDIAVTLTP